jgi:hypothetical protein
MDVKTSDIFQIDSNAVKNALADLDNYKVIYSDRPGVDKNRCVIYFSSNEIYYPNTGKSFDESIIKKDKYEWKNNLLPGAGKHILVRDIQKQWYINGISAQCNTPALLVEKLRELTKGYTIFTVGSSAGGFGALLFGSLLGAKRIYAFNAQMDLRVIMKSSDETIDPLLFRYQSDPVMSQFFNISGFLKEDIEYFYFQSANSQMDLDQYEACTRKELLNRIQFSTSNHGFPFLRHDLKHVFAMSSDKLLELSQSRMHPFVFSVKIHGLFKAALLTVEAVKKRVIKKVKEKKNS